MNCRDGEEPGRRPLALAMTEVVALMKVPSFRSDAAHGRIRVPARDTSPRCGLPRTAG
jgi:hypothetical protein